MDQLISPKNIFYGENSLKKLENILLELKVKKVFLLTDPILLELGNIQPIEEILNNKGIQYDIETDIEAEPSSDNGNRIIKKIRENKYGLVIGVGGGSCLDIAKVAAVLSENEGEISDYLNLT